ncbi:methyl-accepting chemotaxis sensory transducer [Desulfosudis oleivorans Hxd3]|uniref:Methyl-accepting chemotaxis sensory transducer n=2 Tax=Desulfosudis TaxID=2904716 RepID=A8ZWP6_DESOH|nr:methyl-accepting chemotaxis sensory transducer [Desulfosudis oleivorans Hxd3]
MNPNDILKQFKKYGAYGQLTSIGFFVLVFSFAYPLNRDRELLWFLIAFSLSAFIIIYVYFVYWINTKLFRLINTITEKGVLEKLAHNFRITGNRIFSIQIGALVMIYVPVISFMYFYLGYKNLYYHFYVFFISLFIILFLGYFTRNLYYFRTYPIGRFGIPVPVQRLRSKVVSLVLPIILLVNVVISIIVYNLYLPVIKAEIDDNVFMFIKYEATALASLEDMRGYAPAYCAKEGCTLLVTEKNGDIVYAYPDKGMTGKNISTVVERSERHGYFKESTLESLTSSRGRETQKFEGILESEVSVYYAAQLPGGDRQMLAVFPEHILYNNIYRSIFFVTLSLFLLNLTLWVIINRRLRVVSRAIDNVMPAITKATKGDLTQTITVVKSRDVLEDFARQFSAHINNIKEFMIDVIKSAEVLSSASIDVNRTAQLIKSGADEQALSAEKITAALEEIREAVARNSENAKNTDEIAKMSAVSAEAGGASVEKTVASMKEITDKTVLIKDISYKTNLLALNAAIEAARAGEYGRGFAVVAGEVRKLAEKSASVSKEISELSQSALGVSEESGVLLKELVPKSRETAELVREIFKMSVDQSTGVAQIGTDMELLKEIAQRNADVSGEMASISDTFKDQAAILKERITRYKV